MSVETQPFKKKNTSSCSKNTINAIPIIVMLITTLSIMWNILQSKHTTFIYTPGIGIQNKTQATDFIIQPSTTILSEYEYKWCTEIKQSYVNNPNSFGMHYEGKATFKSTYSMSYSFTSQFRQDFLLYSSMFINMQNKKGIYIDLAANHYKEISNTYFIDKCLGWNGFCIEAEPMFWPNLTKYRNCQLISNCIWDSPKELIFESAGPHQVWGAGTAGIAGFNKLKQSHYKIDRKIKMNCTTIQTILDNYNIKHIDFMSLDVEGSELYALKGINWDLNPFIIDVITVENNNGNILTFLEGKGFIKKLATWGDIIFVHQNATDKLRWIDHWIENAKWNKISHFSVL